jgi:hypothetical protein
MFDSRGPTRVVENAARAGKVAAAPHTIRMTDLSIASI